MDTTNAFAVPNITLGQMLAQTVEKYGERSAVYFYGTEMTYNQLFDQVTRFASQLTALGIEKGDRVAIMLPNCPHYEIAYFGIVMVGAIVVQINPMSVEREIDYFLQDSGVKMMVAYGPFLPKIMGSAQGAALQQRIIVDFQPTEREHDGTWISFSDFVAQGVNELPHVDIDPAEDVAVFQYTGGTTGRSKGAMLTHRNLVANAYQSNVLFASQEGEQERVLTVIPMFHVYAMTSAMNSGIVGGAQLIMLPRFDLEEVLETIKATRPTLFPGVPTMYIAVNSHPRAMEAGIDSIRLCVSGSAPMPVEIMHAFEAKTGAAILEGYGLSEASPVTHFNPQDKRKPGSIGKPIALTESKVVDLATGLQELPPGEVGELIIRGPQVMKGYWNMPEETAVTLRDGWLYTGDLARVDEEGYVYIVDRKKDMILAGGFNVYPRDVEEVLYQHPSIQEAVVVGVPDPYRGETVKAFIVQKPNADLTEEAVIAFCREHLAAYKAPRLIEFRDSLPKTAVGKILRRTLAEEARQMMSPNK